MAPLGQVIGSRKWAGGGELKLGRPEIGRHGESFLLCGESRRSSRQLLLGEERAGETLQLGWETDTETAGVWLEITFPEVDVVRELWILSKPIPYEIVLDPYRRGDVTATPRKITYSFAGGRLSRVNSARGNTSKF